MSVDTEFQCIITALKSQIQALKNQKAATNDETIIIYLNDQIQASNDALYKLSGKSIKKLKELLNEN